jgi:4'-phosphopantetheinyl transferase
MSVFAANAFAPCHAPPSLDEGVVHLWFCDTGATPAREVRLAARATLEHLLRAYAGSTSAPTIETGPHGKPFAPELPWLEFNLSHAGRHAMFAFARGQVLGVDIEERGRRVSVEGIAARFFSPAEAAALDAIAAEHRPDAFLHLWTHKEAVLKALGCGLSFGLDRVEFSLGDDGVVGPLRRIAAEAGRAEEWQLCRLAPAAGVVGSLAWRGPMRALQGFRWIA